MALLIIPVLKGDRELEVHTATYAPGIYQSQHMTYIFSVSGIVHKPVTWSANRVELMVYLMVYRDTHIYALHSSQPVNMIS